MPNMRWWFECAYALIISCTGAGVTALVASAGGMPTASTWLLIVLTGLGAAARAGYVAWPAEVPRTWQPPLHPPQEEP